MSFRERYIGDRAFYKRLLTVVGPMIVQNVITSFVNLLDNVMVGQIGTESMSGVAIVNQLLFVFNLCIFGGLAGVGIFTAQYSGKGDDEGVRRTVRLKIYLVVAAFLIFAAALALRGEQLISLFLHKGQDDLDLAATLTFGMDYLKIIVWQLIPFAVGMAISSSMRETGETMLPMKAGIIAIFINFILNYILIFGKLGFPAMGVVGAAIATLIARVAECLIVILWAHRHRKDKARFADGLFRSFEVPGQLLKKVAITGAPVLINEMLVGVGRTTLTQSYSLRGLEVVSAMNILNTASNLFFVAYFAMGNAIAIIVGQHLGAGELERAVDEDRKLVAFSVFLNVFVGILMALLSGLIPRMYNTTEIVKDLSARLLLVCAILMPVHAFAIAAYFTVRAGGKTLITFVFDSGYLWVICVPLAAVLCRRTSLPIVPVYLIIELLEIIKCAIGAYIMKSRKWVNNLVKDA